LIFLDAFGVQDPDGIIAISLSMSDGGLEVDHLRFGVPEPGTASLLSLGLALLAHARRRSKGYRSRSRLSAEPTLAQLPRHRITSHAAEC
jgi:hypothetical protein